MKRTDPDAVREIVPDQYRISCAGRDDVNHKKDNEAVHGYERAFSVFFQVHPEFLLILLHHTAPRYNPAIVQKPPHRSHAVQYFVPAYQVFRPVQDSLSVC